MSDTEIQRYLLRDTTEPSQAPQRAINMEMKVLNQMKMNSTTPKTMNIVQNKSGFRSVNAKQGWQPNHKENCIAQEKSVYNCGIMNHFAKMCRKQRQ